MARDATADARFEDVTATATDRPLRLRAETAEDLTVMSSLLQDAVGRTGEIVWARGRRRLVLVLNRFRWEDRNRAETERRSYERVQTALTLEGVLAVRARGICPEDGQTIYSLLAVAFEPNEGCCSGRVRLTLAGDGEILAEVECLDATLADVSRPWSARAARAPDHRG